MTHPITPDTNDQFRKMARRLVYEEKRYGMQYAEETFVKKILPVINQYMLDTFMELISSDEQQDWDSEYMMCNRCDFQTTDDSKDCICVYRNKLRGELRKLAQERFKP